MAKTSYQNQKILSRVVVWGKQISKTSSVIRESFSLPRFFQISFCWPVRLICNFFLRFEVKTQGNLKDLKGPLIIVSNHASWLDPFLIGAAFPFGAKVFPIRYACWHKYYYFPLFRPIVWLFGAFPIKKGIGLRKALGIPLEILKNKGVVGIFPEGKRNREEKILRGKRGPAFLALETETKILPVKIEGTRNMSFGKFWLKKYKARVKIGKTFSLFPQRINKIEEYNRPADFIMEKIREL